MRQTISGMYAKAVWVLASVTLALSVGCASVLPSSNTVTLTDPPELTITIPKDIQWHRILRDSDQRITYVEILSDGSLSIDNCYVQLREGFPRWVGVSFYNNKKDNKHNYIMCLDTVQLEANKQSHSERSRSVFERIYDPIPSAGSIDSLGSAAKTYVVEATGGVDKKSRIFKYRPLAYDEFSMGGDPLMGRPVPTFTETELFKFIASAYVVGITLKYDSPYTLKAREAARKTGRPNAALVDFKTGKSFSKLDIKANMSPPARKVTTLSGGFGSYTLNTKTVFDFYDLHLGFHNNYGSTINFFLIIPYQTIGDEPIEIFVTLYGTLTSLNTVDFNTLIAEVEEQIGKTIRAFSYEYRENNNEGEK
jgi:hypothetical protein